MGFSLTFADPDVWIRDAGDCYEYICCYVDDLLAALKDPEHFWKQFRSPPYNFKLKGGGEPTYHLGADFYRDNDGVLALGTQTYVRRMTADYVRLFGKEPKTYMSALAKNDHPELDASLPCDPDETRKFQSLIGALQWTISLCRLDVACAVMTLGRYRVAPNVGHLDRAKRIVGYLSKYPQGAIRFRTGIPNHEQLYGEQAPEYDWSYTVYGTGSEEIPSNARPPKGKVVRLTTFEDANLMHDYTTGRSATGIIHMVNQTPIDWFSKRQAQVETATYGSEFVAARIATEQNIDLRYTLRMMGVPINGPSWMFGDNQSVITNSTLPHSTLNKRWNALSYHRVREAIAFGILRMHYLHSTANPANVLTKACDHSEAWPIIDTLLFRKGDTKSRNDTQPLTRPEGSNDLKYHG